MVDGREWGLWDGHFHHQAERFRVGGGPEHRFRGVDRSKNCVECDRTREISLRSVCDADGNGFWAEGKVGTTQQCAGGGAQARRVCFP